MQKDPRIFKLPSTQAPMSTLDTFNIFNSVAPQLAKVLSAPTCSALFHIVNDEVAAVWPQAQLSDAQIQTIVTTVYAVMPSKPAPLPKEGKHRSVYLAGLAGILRAGRVSANGIAAVLVAENASRNRPMLSLTQLLELLDKALSFDPARDPWDYDTPAPTDTGNSHRLTKAHGDQTCFCPQLKGKESRTGWLEYNGRRWVPDETGKMQQLVEETLLDYEVEEILRAKIFNASAASAGKRTMPWYLASQSAERRGAMEKLARSGKGIAVHINDFDRDSRLLNTPNGVLDLATGALLPHNRGQLLMRITGAPFDPSARDQKWERFLDEVTGGENELREFLQRILGYALGGDPVEERFPLFIGEGGSGKGTLLEPSKTAAGLYAVACPFETFLKSSSDSRIRNDLAALAGTRIVLASEAPDGAQFNIALLKNLTGRDTISARFLYGEYFEFRPKFVPIFSSNTAPHIPANDTGAWRRILRIPFDNVPRVVDRNLKSYLVHDPGAQAAVLAWMVKGYSMWKEAGLAIPKSIEDATTKYRTDEDSFAIFIEDQCELEPGAFTGSKAIREAYVAWCRIVGGCKPMSFQSMSDQLTAKGFTGGRPSSGGNRERGWIGIKRVTIVSSNPHDQRTVGPEHPALALDYPEPADSSDTEYIAGNFDKLGGKLSH